MNRMWCSIACCLAANLAALGFNAAALAAAPSSVNGEMVDADVPATYRLPVVSSAPTMGTAANSPLPLFLPPISPSVNYLTPIASQIQTYSAPSAAGPPPDDGPVGECNANGATPVEAAENAPQDAQPSEQVPPDALPYTPTASELTSQLLPAVQRGFGLAQRGALYAARTEFVRVLRRVAQAHDAEAKTHEHSRALAAGLRALDEAEDFVPDGVQLEVDLNVRAVSSSHRTAVLPDETKSLSQNRPRRGGPSAADGARHHFAPKTPQNEPVPDGSGIGSKEVSAFEAVALYHAFAQEQLAKAVDAEQVGSMALYGLGKIYARQAERRDDDVQLARSAMTMYSAALAACPDNHLAANELGVLVCRAGRASEAARLFERTIDVAPSATAYHNLAMAQLKIGLHGQAAANEFESQRLTTLERARGEVSRRAGVQWVAPADMAHVSQPAAWTPAAATPPVAQPPAKSPWQRTMELTKALPRPGSGGGNEGLRPTSEPRVASPVGSAAPRRLQWR